MKNKFIKKFDFDTDNDIREKIRTSHETFLNWKNKSLEERLNKIENLSKNLDKHKINLANLITLEMVYFYEMFFDY